MRTVQIRNVIIGDGRPKICVPIVGKTQEEILLEARKITHTPADVVEWRVDWYDDCFQQSQVEDTARKLQSVLNGLPLLFTFRTAKEGGEKTISIPDYVRLNTLAAQCDAIDLIDVEAFTGDEEVVHMIQQAHLNHTKVIASNHDFYKTPSREEIIRRLCLMQDLGADIPKIAVMPACKKDVLTLLEATLEMYENFADRPFITMSMSGTGMISRLSGECFGSALTFGAAGKTSAPGQIDVNSLEMVLDTIHFNQ